MQRSIVTRLAPADASRPPIQQRAVGVAGKLRRARFPYRSVKQSPGSVTLLKAPIGFGKSTLLKQWLSEAHAHHEKALLLTLTASDRTIEGLSASFARIGVSAGPSIAPPASRGSFEQLLTGDHAAAMTVLIDNWDAILASESEERIAEVICSGKLRVNLCIASRRGHGLPIDTLLADGRLRVIGQNALRFSDGEQRRLLGPALWSRTSADVLAACDGWPLALVLLKCVEQAETTDVQSPPVFARRSGLEAIVTKQLAQSCTPREAELLDILGLSSDFDVPLLNEIRDAADSDELLDGVASLLPFGMHPDDTGLRYRPAALVQAILRRRFDAIGSARQKAFASRAFQKAMGQGRALEAINFALLSQDPERAIELLETIGPLRLMMMYGVERIQDILRRVPLPLLACSPRLRLALSVTFAKHGCLAEAREMVDATIHEIEDSAIAPVPKSLALRDGAFVRIQVSACTNRDWADDFERGAATELAKEPAYAAWSRVISGIVKHQLGRLDEAEAHFDRAQVVCEQIRADYQLVHLKLHRAHVDLARGKLRAAAHTLREVKRTAATLYPADVGLPAVSELGLVEASLLSSRSSVQRQTLAGALASLRQSDSWYEPCASALVSMSRCLWRDEGLDAMLHGLEDAEAELRGRGITIVSDLSELLRAFYLALAGRRAAAEILLQTYEKRRSDESRSFWRERHLLGLVTSMLSASKDSSRAIAIADQVIDESRRDGRKLALVEAHLNRAWIVLSIGDRQAEGLVALAFGLELACDLGAYGCLSEWRDLIEEHAIAVQPHLHPRTREMLTSLCTEWQGRVQPDLLSDKEIDVLKGVANRLTNKQIGRQLDVSVDTVKFHLKQCFRKLSAQSRADAVQKARAAQLI